MISLSITYHELSNEIQKINIAISCNILTVRKSCKFKTTEFLFLKVHLFCWISRNFHHVNLRYFTLL